MTEKDWLPYQLKTIKNLADIDLILGTMTDLDLLDIMYQLETNLAAPDKLIPTILELIQIEVQQITEEHCVMEEK